jgi:hypothetical protein
MEQMTMLEALRQIEETQPGGLLYQESQQVADEWEVRELWEVITELENDEEIYGDDPYEQEYIIEWLDGIAYLTPMDRHGYRDERQSGDLPDRVKWED